MKSIKIVATIGPRTNSPEAIRKLAEAGMDVARLNGSHSDLKWHEAAIRAIRAAAPGTPILLDIPGRKIRTCRLEHEPSFAAGDTVVLTTDTAHDGRHKVPVSYGGLHRDLSSKDTILADDGQLRFTVLKVKGQDIICRAEVAGTLRSRKGINVPSVTLRKTIIGENDRGMLEFARKQGVDFIGVSFVESAAEVQDVREALGEGGPRIVAKIENQKALKNAAEIAAVSDAVMIDRGDLSVETSLENVALFQKNILAAAAAQRCPVIVATEMLHCMIQSPAPSKAEVSDITNAVLDGASALMLSGETAVGAYPEQAVLTMRRVADAAWAYLQTSEDGKNAALGIPQAMGEAVALLCRRLPITKIVAVTISGFAARMVAGLRPRQPILAVSNDAENARAFNLLPGTRGLHVDLAFSKTDTAHIPACLEALWRLGELQSQDMILVTAVSYPKKGNRMNLIETHVVADLAKALGWKR